MDRTINDSLTDFTKGFSNALLVEKPCTITKVNNQYSVDVEYYDNGKIDFLYNVPVKHVQSQKAYLFLGLSVGDAGTVRFFDCDVTDYVNPDSFTNLGNRSHDINDNLFSLGFYPDKSKYTFINGDIVIGTVSGAVINLTGNNITITGGNITLGDNTTIDGKVFLQHQHSNGNEGSPTGGVI